MLASLWMLILTAQGSELPESGLSISAWTQMDYTLDGSREPTQQLAPSRVRLEIEAGLSEDYSLFVSMGLAPQDVLDSDGISRTAPLLDASLDAPLWGNTRIRAGQFVVPFANQRMRSARLLQFSERSDVEKEFGLDRDAGFAMRSNQLFGLSPFEGHLGLFTGEGRNHFSFSDLGLLGTARLSFFPVGRFGDDWESSLAAEPHFRAELGAGLAYHRQAKRLSGLRGPLWEDGGSADYFQFTLDLQVKRGRFSSLGAVHWRRGHRNEAKSSQDPRAGSGWSSQAGFFLRPRFEIAARMERIQSSELASGLQSSHRAVLGGNWFLGPPGCMLQAQIYRAWEDALADSPTYGIGLSLVAFGRGHLQSPGVNAQ
jgi:hypothetical protein